MEVYEEDLTSANSINNSISNRATKNLNKRQKTSKQTAVKTKTQEVEQKPIEGECAICFEDMDKSKEDVAFCRFSCGQNFHHACILIWCNNKSDANITCPLCRAKWFQ